MFERLGAEIDAFYAQDDVLEYRRNKDYAGRRVMWWQIVSATGELAGEDGVLSFRSEHPGDEIETPLASRSISGGILEFEARSPVATPMRVSWTRLPSGEFTEREDADVPLTVEWRRVSLTLEHPGILRRIRMGLPEGGEFEIRNARLRIPDGTVIMDYGF